MRTIVLCGIALSAFGCSETCGLGNQLDGRVYEGFAHVVTIDSNTSVNLEEMPTYASPINGPLTIGFEWGPQNSGPITVFMNGQTFEGNGAFYENECGNFSASWSGVYTGEEQANGKETLHGVSAAGVFRFYDEPDGRQVLAADLEWEENWSFDGAEGKLVVPLAELSASIGGAATTTQTQ